MYPHIFQPLQFPTFSVKNRIFRSNVSGRFDNYDGSGNQRAHQLGAEVRARRGRRDHLLVRAGAHPRPHRAELRDDRQRRAHARSGGSWAREVHEHDCRFIMQLSHGGWQRDIPGDRVPEGPELHRHAPSRCTASNASA